MDKRCSVCMAAYNGGRHIKQQARSILEQLGPADELIVSDDSSTDDTIAELRSLNDPRIRIIQNKFQKGPVGNFSSALSEARFDYIFLADQDDRWLPGRVSRHIGLLDQYELVISDAVVTTEDGAVLFDSFFKARGAGPGLLKNLLKNSYLGCCMSFTRSLLTKAYPFPEGLYMHDWWFGLVAELNGSVCFCPEVYTQYIRHAENVTQTLQKPLPFSKQLRNRAGLIKGLIRLKLNRKKK